MISLTLPMDATFLIPHRPPVQLIDRLLTFDGDSGVVEARVPIENPFVEQGGVTAPLLLELMAQACAALKGYQDLYAGEPIKKGYLVAIKRTRFAGSVMAGEQLIIKVHVRTSFGGFTVAEAGIEGDRGLLAKGEITLWVPEEGSTSRAQL